MHINVYIVIIILLLLLFVPEIFINEIVILAKAVFHNGTSNDGVVRDIPFL